MYKDTSLQLFVNQKEINKNQFQSIIEIVENYSLSIIKESNFKTFKIRMVNSDNIEMKGEKYFVFTIGGMIPEHILQSIINSFIFLNTHISGHIYIDKKLMENKEISWEMPRPNNLLLKFTKTNKRMEEEITLHKEYFSEFQDSLANS